ncbi:MAG TPA: hypothetical protein VNK73_03620 [Actinomycetota bacterium]|nr:hypothetical protein [Actinomycetota bacterium]
MTRPRLIAGLAIPVALAIAIVLVLFTNRDQESPPTITAAAPTTIPPTTQPPQDQWLGIMRQILDYRHSLFVNPRPELLKEIYDVGCPCYSDEFKQLTDLRQQGLHYNDRGTEVQRTKQIGSARDPAKPVVAIEVTSRQFPQILVDRSGKVIRQSPASTLRKNIYELIRGADGRWRVYLVYRA